VDSAVLFKCRNFVGVKEINYKLDASARPVGAVIAETAGEERSLRVRGLVPALDLSADWWNADGGERNVARGVFPSPLT
jgi:hypothetical protein